MEAKVTGPGVVTGRFGTLGQVFYLKQDFWPLNTTLFVKDFKGNDPRFVSYLLETIDYRAHDDKSTIPGVNRNHLHQTPIVLPPLADQVRIARLLGALDDKMIASRVLRDELQALRLAFFQLLVRDRLADVSLPPGWHRARLRDVADVNARTLAVTDARSKVRYIDISSVGTGELNNITTMDRAQAPGRARRLVAEGDTIWSTVRPNRRSYLYVDKAISDAVVSTGFAVITPRVVPPSYLYSWLTTNEFVDYLTNNADGSAYPAVASSRFDDAEVVVPTRDAMVDFDKVAGPILARVAICHAEVGTLRQLRETLLRPIVLGQHRLS